ncbi:MAG TPA: hypothetical protein VE326_05830 [Candidatus Binatia bacterium]|nr:hypothetical protein [Candidatus Binatia bacterium]
MSDPLSSPSYRPIGEEPSGASALLRHVLPLALVAVVAVGFLAPELLRRVLPGVDPIAARMTAIVGLFLFVAITGIREGRRRLASRRSAFASFAASVGGRVTERRPGPGPSAWEAAGHVEYDVQGRPAVLSAVNSKEASFAFRLACDVALGRDFQFQILPGGRAMRFVLSKSFLLPVLSVAVKTSGSGRASVRRWTVGADGSAAGSMTDPAQLIDRMRYLADDPVTTGDTSFDNAYLVKASDRDAGRAFASDPGFRAAIAALAGRAPTFQVGLESETAGGTARLVIAATAEASPELFLAMDGALRATVAGLARAGIVDGARGVA